jgi:hypothetical protein
MRVQVLWGPSDDEDEAPMVPQPVAEAEAEARPVVFIIFECACRFCGALRTMKTRRPWCPSQWQKQRLQRPGSGWFSSLHTSSQFIAREREKEREREREHGGFCMGPFRS